MTENNNKLSTINKPQLGNKFGLQKRIAEKQTSATADFSKFPNRLGLVMDDSGSMGDMTMCHQAIEAFIKNCNPNDTAITLYPLNVEQIALTNNFASIGIYVTTIQATGSTPLYKTLNALITNENITRAVAFSDGSPTDYDSDGENIITAKYIAKKIPIDTIFIGQMYDWSSDDNKPLSKGYTTMKMIAEKTGGIFLHFTDVSVLAKSLKYLTPHYRALLADDNTRQKVERGVL